MDATRRRSPLRLLTTAAVLTIAVAGACNPADPMKPAPRSRPSGAPVTSAATTCGGAGQACCPYTPTCGPNLDCLPGAGGDTCVQTSPRTGICRDDELQCGNDCASVADAGFMDPWCNGGSFDPWCYSDMEGPFYLCPVGPLDGGGTRWACSYIWGDAQNCGGCGIQCAEGQWCGSGTCYPR